MSLFKKIVKLAYEKPEIREQLMPLLKVAASNQALVKAVKALKGVQDVKVLADKPTPYGDREVVLGLFLDPKIGSEIGRQDLSGKVTKLVPKALAKHKEYTFLRSISPAPGLDPWGRHDMSWDTHPEKFKKYYGRNPLKVILQASPKGDKKAAKELHMALQELPPALQKALKAVGYRRKDVRVQERTSYSPSEGTAGFTGNRGYVVAVNLSTGQMKQEQGSWGGSNPFSQTQVDDDHKKYPIPPNGAVIIGEGGGRGSFAKILIHPTNLRGILPTTDDLSEEEKQALTIIKGIKGGHRARYFEDNSLGPYNKTNPLLQSLAKKGMVKINARGSVMITTNGKNAISGYRPPFFL